MSLFVGSSQEETFRLLMDYFTGRRMRILMSHEPSYIRADLGSYVSMSLGHAKGEVEVNTVKRNGGCYVNLNFNFVKEYAVDGIVAIFLFSLIFGFGWWMISISGLRPWTRLEIIPLFLWATVGFAIVMAIAGYNVSLTRRRFIEEFNMFVQSLSTKNQ